MLVQLGGSSDVGDPACCADIFQDRCVDYSFTDANGVCVFRQGFVISNAACLPGGQAAYWWYEVYYLDSYDDGGVLMRLLQVVGQRFYTATGFTNPLFFAQSYRPIAEMNCSDILAGWSDWDILQFFDVDSGSQVAECPNWDMTTLVVTGKVGSCP